MFRQKKWSIGWPVLTLLILMLIISLAGAMPCAAANSCVDCHGSRTAMESLGGGEFVVTPQEVARQSRMPAECADCHLGNPTEPNKEKAHAGLARLIVVEKKGLRPMTSARRFPLEYGDSRINRVVAVTERNGKRVPDASVAAISWHDKRRDTLSQDFATMAKTCGKCHEKEFAEFSRSTMASNAKQSRYKGWVDPARGPHNCGPWFDGNFDSMQANTTVPMSTESHRINQRVCNTCHVGCLDCHYNPQNRTMTDPGKGPHAFVKTPPPEGCYGNGRASICHAGPEERRRGAGYFGGAYSFPEGNPPDAHLTARVGCLDCHESTRTDPGIGHGMVRRQAAAACERCHAVAVKSHAASIHKNLACEACHIQQVAGYQGTYWGPGNIAGAATPYFKFKAYYGVMPEPILIRDQKGRWIPVKPFPMAVMNQKESPFKPGLYWRYPADLPDLRRTDDAWAYVGLFGGLPENNKALLWIQMDKMSHKIGKSRSCESCHATADGSQLQRVAWEYSDPGALPFAGSHEVLANRNGLFIRNMSSEKIELENGYTLSALAPWVYLKERWQVSGDFSIPPIRDRIVYNKLRSDAAKARSLGIIHR